MRSTLHPKLIAGRVRNGPFWSDETHGHNGYFLVPGPNGAELKIIASDAREEPDRSEGWEHVSVSLRNRCPNWPEMTFAKSLFWEPEETVVQLHPPESTYISNHPYCLHLWRDTRLGHALPPAILVGSKVEGELTGPEHAASVMRRLGANKTRPNNG
jgi:hypothetical protein